MDFRMLLIHILRFAALAVFLSAAGASAGSGDIQLETGILGFSRNDVRIPGDGGTRFDMLDLTGSGPEPVARLLATWQFHPRHALRLTLAPLETRGTGRLDRDTTFEEVLFPAGVDTKGRYRFNTYRLAYRWTFHESRRWRWGFGASALVRDAEVSLEQPGLKAAKDDLGLVPLLHLRGEYWMNDQTALVADVEGAAAAQGRAIDAALQLQWDFRPGWRAAAGYRTIEGGADNDEVYTFAWLHQVVVSLGARF